MPCRTYCESVVIATSQVRVSAASPAMAAMSSMRLLVERTSAPDKVFSLPLYRRITPHPPGPGLPRHAQSVSISTRFVLVVVVGGGFVYLSHQRWFRLF